MTYQRFEDLPVWQEAIRLAEMVYGLTEDAAFQKQYSLRDQLERAAVSVSAPVPGSGFGPATSLHVHAGAGGDRLFQLGVLRRPDGHGGRPIQSPARLEVTPPNDYSQLTVSFQGNVCDHGTLTVSPVFGAGCAADPNHRTPQLLRGGPVRGPGDCGHKTAGTPGQEGSE